MAESLLRSIAIHDALHPASAGRTLGLPGGGMARGGISGMAAMGNPNGGFLDNITGSPLGQIGMALLAGGGGGLGGAAQMLMQQSMYNRLARAQQTAASTKRVEHIGNTIGMIDPQTGEFTPTYTAPAQQDEFEREMAAADIDPASDEGKALLRQRTQNMADPTVNIPLPGGQAYVGPKSGLEAALQRLQGGSGTPGALAPPAAAGGLPAAVVAAERSPGDFVNGQPLTSSAGAKYKMQVMPATAANPGYGVTPAANDSAAEYDRVGTDYIGKLAQQYGDPQKALAAYNWGPGNLDHDIAANGPNWLGAAPSNVRSYVARGASALGGGNSAGGGDVAAQAQAAIAAGADPAKVRARAMQMGVTLP